MSQTPRSVILIRRDLTGAGGAERVFKKYQAALGKDCDLIPVNEATGTRGPGWWRAMHFTRKADRIIQQNPKALSITLERGPSALVFRTGDGVHQHYRHLMGRFSVNPWHWVAPMLDQKSLRAAKIVIANSQMVAHEIAHYYRFAADKIRVVHNGFDPKNFFVVDEAIEPKEKIRERLGLPVKGALFLFAGSGWKRKGLSQALKIAQLCKHLNPALVLIGKGKSSQIGGPAIYKGVVDNIADYYRACDALILPTLYDPFASVVLEALACGMPVVTTAQNGAAEVIENNVTGYVMPGQNKNLSQAAAWLEANIGNVDREKIAASVREWTLEREINEIKKIFKELETR